MTQFIASSEDWDVPEESSSRAVWMKMCVCVGGEYEGLSHSIGEGGWNKNYACGGSTVG